MTQKEIDLLHDFIDADLVMEDTLDHDDTRFATSLEDAGYVERIDAAYRTLDREALEAMLDDDRIGKLAVRATRGRA